METFCKDEIIQYLRMLDKSRDVANLLKYDVFFRLVDNYLIAAVFVYLKRSGIKPSEYSSTFFFLALALAHKIFEDNDLRAELTAFALPLPQKNKMLEAEFHYSSFLMAEAMQFRCYISRSCCDKLMSIVPHPVWRRQRGEVFGGVTLYKIPGKGESYDAIQYNISDSDSD